MKLWPALYHNAPQGAPLAAFRTSLALIWGIYDLIDLVSGRSLAMTLGQASHSFGIQLALLQAILIFSQVCIVRGKRVQLMCLVACLARSLETVLFSLNDFIYHSVMMFLCVWIPPHAHDMKSTQQARLHNVFIWQTAWLYFATAFLKLNPSWLSGGDLYVRQTFLAYVSHWPYPPSYRACIETLSCNHVLAMAAVLGEFLLAFLLVAMMLLPRWRSWWARSALALCVAIHTFAALSTNVWFFGASMIAQVGWLCRPGASRPKR